MTLRDLYKSSYRISFLRTTIYKIGRSINYRICTYNIITIIQKSVCSATMGGDLGGLKVRFPPNLRWGWRMHLPPNISRSSVIGCVSKYELTKTRYNGGIFCSSIEFLMKKMVMYTETGKRQTEYGHQKF